jgi:hypothetical protein
MNKRKLSSMAMVAAMTAVLSLGGGLSFAAQGDPAKPSSAHLAAKREMVRQQQEQRVTQSQRKAAAKNLQAERLKVYNAKQAVKKSAPQTIENK